MSIYGQLGTSRKDYNKRQIQLLEPSSSISDEDLFAFDVGSTTITSLLGTQNNLARSRQKIYEKWSEMESDAICSSALELHVTSALGSDETTGDMVFIEKKSHDMSYASEKIVEQIAEDLSPIFNSIAIQSAYTATAFGDSFARIYSENKTGIVDIYIDELVRPPLIQAYQKGSRTVGFVAYGDKHQATKLNMQQMVRLKMPRKQWTPQQFVVEKSMRFSLKEDKVRALPVLPAMAGGSFLFPAEKSYHNLKSSIAGLVGQRLMDSIDEKMIQVNMKNMSKDQQRMYSASITQMLERSKKAAEKAAKTGIPLLERIRHIIPVWDEKQIATDAGVTATGRSESLTIEDIMLHAKMLAGSMGIDLSLLGFSEILSGGLGEGGFFRTSAQAAERSKVIRNGLEDFYNSIIDIHTYKKYGIVFSAKERPWKVNFYGTISALDSENQRTRTEKVGSASLLIASIQQLKDLGTEKSVIKMFLINEMGINEKDAEFYASFKEEEAV